MKQKHSYHLCITAQGLHHGMHACASNVNMAAWDNHNSGCIMTDLASMWYQIRRFGREWLREIYASSQTAFPGYTDICQRQMTELKLNYTDFYLVYTRIFTQIKMALCSSKHRILSFTVHSYFYSCIFFPNCFCASSLLDNWGLVCDSCAKQWINSDLRTRGIFACFQQQKNTNGIKKKTTHIVPREHFSSFCFICTERHSCLCSVITPFHRGLVMGTLTDVSPIGTNCIHRFYRFCLCGYK